ncbi:MAG: HAD family hydrolase [Chloroflexi bacterium]|nr:HAD family hydrolase [Chloroflexota bacterium]
MLIERLAPGLEDRVGRAEVMNMGRLIDRTFIESPPRLLDGAADVLRELVGRGLKIGLISNTGLTSPATYNEWFAQLGILDSFDFLAFSNAQQVAKPAPAIFETTLAEINVIASRGLHIGDNLHTDVGGAAAVGMSTVWVRGGISSAVATDVEPNFSIDSILELPGVIDDWLYSLDD